MWMIGLMSRASACACSSLMPRAQRQPARDLLIVIQLRQVFGIGNEGDEPVAALRGLADVAPA